MTPAASGGNVAERLARIEERQEQHIEAIKALTAEVREANRCQSDLAKQQTDLAAQVKNHADEIKRLRDADRLGNVITGGLAVLAGAIGAWFK